MKQCRPTVPYHEYIIKTNIKLTDGHQIRKRRQGKRAAYRKR